MSSYIYNDNSIVTFVINVFFSSLVHDTNVQVREERGHVPDSYVTFSASV